MNYFRFLFLCGTVGAKTTHSPKSTTQRTNTPTSTTQKTSGMTTSSPTSPIDRTFLHLTDLHLSASRPYSVHNLEYFCEAVLPHISDSVAFIAITGDFTDGIGSFVGLGQFEQQASDWNMYMHAIQKCSGLPIFTIRGNHDCFGVHSFGHETNAFFRQTRKNLKYQNVHESSGSFAFELDGNQFVFLEQARILPAPHQYHGEFSGEQALWVKEILLETNTKMTYVFGHYPLGSLIPDSRERLLDALSGTVSRVTYLSGHIHSVVGRQGVQALRSHRFVDELQLSDFKWSGIVRKVDVATASFVDIPTLNWTPTTVSATVLFDPDVRYGENRHSQVSVFARNKIISAVHCGNDGRMFPMAHATGGISVFDVGSDFSNVCVVFQDGTQKKVDPVDTRLWDKSFKKFVFSYFFEFLQLVLLIVYTLTVLVARHLYLKFSLVLVPLYLVLSPLVPTSIGGWVFGRDWVAANGIAMIDLQSGDVFFDSETTRVGFTLAVYLLCALGLVLRLMVFKNVWLRRLARIASLLLSVPLAMLDFRMALARGGVRSLLASPHTWFMGYLAKGWVTSYISK